MGSRVQFRSETPRGDRLGHVLTPLPIAFSQGAQTVWITAWKLEDAAAKLEASATRLPDDKVVRVKVNRDYTKSDRKDAPYETPGMT